MDVKTVATLGTVLPGCFGSALLLFAAAPAFAGAEAGPRAGAIMGA
jgi:hypothetical protein